MRFVRFPAFLSFIALPLLPLWLDVSFVFQFDGVANRKAERANEMLESQDRHLALVIPNMEEYERNDYVRQLAAWIVLSIFERFGIGAMVIWKVLLWAPGKSMMVLGQTGNNWIFALFNSLRQLDISRFIKLGYQQLGRYTLWYLEDGLFESWLSDHTDLINFTHPHARLYLFIRELKIPGTWCWVRVLHGHPCWWHIWVVSTMWNCLPCPTMICPSCTLRAWLWGVVCSVAVYCPLSCSISWGFIWCVFSVGVLLQGSLTHFHFRHRIYSSCAFLQYSGERAVAVLRVIWTFNTSGRIWCGVLLVNCLRYRTNHLVVLNFVVRCAHDSVVSL